ncbi:MAG: ATP-dependent Clp protease adaptor ClpS [Flavobacteriia bacterium]|jgi:ATP-dependent Clp protease adaptor protein ClpS|nr:ATP-dependent Clp protease adaptor ClpS [Flavobacteriia bacterium]
MSKKAPSISPEEIVDLEVLSEREHELILYNDDVNTFEHVIECLVKYCDHTFIQAEQCAYIVHFSGKCTVKSGTMEDLTPRCSALLESGLSAEIV